MLAWPSRRSSLLPGISGSLSSHLTSARSAFMSEPASRVLAYLCSRMSMGSDHLWGCGARRDPLAIRQITPLAFFGKPEQFADTIQQRYMLYSKRKRGTTFLTLCSYKQFLDDGKF